MRLQEEADLQKVLISIFVLLSASAQASVIGVGPGQSIQAAIDAANPGDTINVFSGTYYERINVMKTLSLSGIDNGGGRPVLDAGGVGSAVTLSSGGSNLFGFEIRNSRGTGSAGIEVVSSGNTISGNIVHDSNKGIELSGSSRNTIGGNVADNNALGIYVISSGYNTIVNNIASNNDYGIRIEGSVGNTIQGNILRGSSYYDAYDSGTNYWGLNGFGNYYSQFRLPEQGCWDSNGDGICDRWYDIPGGSNVDWSPLTGWDGPAGGSAYYGSSPQFSYISTIASSSSISIS